MVFTPNLEKKLEHEIVLLMGGVSKGENSILLCNWANGRYLNVKGTTPVWSSFSVCVSISSEDSQSSCKSVFLIFFNFWTSEFYFFLYEKGKIADNGEKVLFQW